ncbi:MAG: DNA replication and repair protein RecF [Nannocystaceae bacterium]|nr:DNA replication and repair protein RecF [Nannocystaceae bacterium]
MSAEIDLQAGFTVLWGHNGAGKTNVLEAVYLVSTLRSFRTSDTSALVRWDAPGASVELKAFDPKLDTSTTLSVRMDRRGNGARRTASADGKVVRSAAQFYGRIKAVLFTPEDLAVLRGSPSGRRQFMDRVLFARDRAHITDTQAYEKLVRSRNAVLRDPVSPTQKADLLATYETGLAEIGARIWSRRVEMLSELSDPFATNFARIHGQRGSNPKGGDGPVAKATLRYATKLEEKLEREVPAEERNDTLRSELERRRFDDERRGGTSVGPHRDDLIVELDGQPAGEFASQGQARALVLAFKLSELESTAALTGVPPILLLDDVSSELDPTRSAMLLETLVSAAGQCILTTTAPHFVALPGGVEASLVQVDRGTLGEAVIARKP